MVALSSLLPLVFCRLCLMIASLVAVVYHCLFVAFLFVLVLPLSLLASPSVLGQGGRLVGIRFLGAAFSAVPCASGRLLVVSWPCPRSVGGLRLVFLLVFVLFLLLGIVSLLWGGFDFLLPLFSSLSSQVAWLRSEALPFLLLGFASACSILFWPLWLWVLFSWLSCLVVVRRLCCGWFSHLLWLRSGFLL